MLNKSNGSQGSQMQGENINQTCKFFHVVINE